MGGACGKQSALWRKETVMAYVIAEPCIGTKDSACVDACPVDCIHPKKDENGHGEVDQLFIDPVECIDCGACVPVCPVSAIYAGDDLPDKWAEYQEKNAAHFGRSVCGFLLGARLRLRVLLLRRTRRTRRTLRFATGFVVRPWVYGGRAV